ncbi:thioesterase family protein [Solirubrobacter sp. CPCC 204708]|uniref:Thioesterase family protein n=1 Tax=Solirubrobacter deserti TaxID=2282478 RepID=A0ABT4RFT7_9ACTN|nr:thioesterase family protein [Solirubrobacter deserti]MBE2318131.1 thioesterase family protein [Solirubrobacter deserti]MDA0137409.1 thioesterase family protein [Solirubrobacter deserti]
MSFYVDLGEGRFRATKRTSGPWDPAHQHAGPPSALMLRAFERLASELVIARITIEILGPVAIGEMDVRVEVERPGRSVELLAGSIAVDGREVLRARAWRVRPAPAGTVEEAPVDLPEQEHVPPAALGETFGYAHAVEWRWARGGWLDRGPATVWTRMKIPLIEGEEPSPRQRVTVVADSGNGASNVLDWARYLFINTELTVHFVREPVGEWVLLDAATQIAEGGAGLASSVLSDRTGPVARGAQALLVAPR